MKSAQTHTSIGAIVADDFRTAAVFERFGIDFCCGGGQSFDEACRSASADPADVQRELDAIPPAQPRSDDAAHWPLDRLIDHILSHHHEYVRAALPLIGGYLDRLIAVHGARHPELIRVASHFPPPASGLNLHMLTEGQVLFSSLRALAGTPAN